MDILGVGNDENNDTNPFVLVPFNTWIVSHIHDDSGDIITMNNDEGNDVQWFCNDNYTVFRSRYILIYKLFNRVRDEVKCARM